ncbi:MAG: hypothetical protein ACT4QF_23295 [Sporichthyaceae bacterium]
MNNDPIVELLRRVEAPGTPGGATRALAKAKASRRRRRAGAGAGVLAVVVAAAALLAPEGPSTARDVVVPASDAPAPQTDFSYVIVKPLVESKKDIEAPIVLPARARELLECLPSERRNLVGESPRTEPASQAQDALGGFVRAERAIEVPKARWREAGAGSGEILYTVRAQQRLVGAVVVANGAEGWTVRSFGFCSKNWRDTSYLAGPLPEVWTTVDGTVAQPEKVSSYIGAGHCNHQSVVSLTINGGRSLDTPGRRSFARDPEGLLLRLWLESGKPTNEYYRGWADAQRGFDAHATLPEDATDTGFRRGGVALWTAGDAAYLVGGDRTERWAEVGQGPGCM